eukprot:SAG31_NODE_5550_length_2464_cov_4.620296_2_plen_148_part_00
MRWLCESNYIHFNLIRALSNRDDLCERNYPLDVCHCIRATHYRQIPSGSVAETLAFMLYKHKRQRCTNDSKVTPNPCCLSSVRPLILIAHSIYATTAGDSCLENLGKWTNRILEHDRSRRSLAASSMRALTLCILALCRRDPVWRRA